MFPAQTSAAKQEMKMSWMKTTLAGITGNPSPPVFEGGDVIGLLPPVAVAKLTNLRTLADDESAKLHAIVERRNEAREKRVEARSQIQRIKNNHTYALGQTTADEHPSIRGLTAQMAAADAELLRIELPYRARVENASMAGRLVANIETYGRANARGKMFQAFSGTVPGLRKSETALEGVLRWREEVEAIQKRLQTIETAAVPIAAAKAAMADIVDQLAERGIPDLFGLLERRERAEKIVWPTVSPGTMMEGLDGPARANLLFVKNFDALGMMCWLFRDHVIERLEAELALRSDDTAALTDAEQAKQLQEVSAALLLAQRAEEAAIELTERDGGAGILRRPDANPLAVLGIVANQ
jgi:hypothetical protein